MLSHGRFLPRPVKSQHATASLLDRHRWRKLMPRPFHPQRDVEAQNDFKENAFLAP
jgi:hypothetical protein